MGFVSFEMSKFHISEPIFSGCILNPGHGKIPAPDFNFYIQKDKYPI